MHIKIDELRLTLTESLSLLRSRRFGTFWFASLLSNIGTWAQQVAQPWLLLSLGASSFLIGLDTFTMGAPVWLLTLVGGVLADRADRRHVIAFFQSIQMLCPLILVMLLLTGQTRPWMVILLSLVVGITDALSMPSFQSIVPTIVERTRIASGLALNATQFNLSRILGPVAAGLLMVSVGAVGCFAINAASYIPFIAVALWILPRGKTYQETLSVADRFSFRHSIVGFREIIALPRLKLSLLIVFFTSGLCGPLITFIPVLVKDIFRGSAGDFSIMVGAFGIGGLIGAIVLLTVSARYDRQKLNAWFASGYALCVIAIALNPWLTVLPVLLVLAGFSMSICNISANTLLQASAPVQLRGQAVSLFMLSMRGGMALGSLVTGMSVSILGTRQSLLINGIIALLLIALFAWREKLFHLDKT